ncbi:MAG TPA: DNA polymerase IV [Tepidisphaeraceae bacterium]|nr:DNA polymerase IV [Tepidisphaeraceae bacterium]
MASPAPRAILHVDMDAFFASVEQRDNPAIRGKPVLVGGAGPRGVVAAASYEARKFGCHSAQPMAVARRNCPQAVIVRGNYAEYRRVSDQVMAIFERFTPLIQPVSIDEAFLDVTGSLRAFGPAEQIAADIRAAVRAETHLTCSVGVAPNKFLAKLASDMNKPDGLAIVRPDAVDALLAPLPVGKLWGIGPKTAHKLNNLNLRTVADLRRLSDEALASLFGTDGDHYKRLIYGLDDRPVTPDHQAKSIGQEETFGVDVQDHDQLRDTLFAQAEEVGRRLRKHSLRARAVWVKIRFGDYQTISRQATLREPTDLTTALFDGARALFDAWAAESFQPVRLIGMAAKGLSGDDPQLPLFPDPAAQKQRTLDAVADQINQRLGRGSVKRARSLPLPDAPDDEREQP